MCKVHCQSKNGQYKPPQLIESKIRSVILETFLKSSCPVRLLQYVNRHGKDGEVVVGCMANLRKVMSDIIQKELCDDEW